MHKDRHLTENLKTYFENDFMLYLCIDVILKPHIMLKKGEHIEGIPSELQELLKSDNEAMRSLKTYQIRTRKVIAIGLALPNKKIPEKYVQIKP